MRSQAFIQRSRSLLRASTVSAARPLVKPHVSRSLPRNIPPSRPSVYGKRLSSSSTTPVSASDVQHVESPEAVSEPPPVNASGPPETPSDEPEKTRRKPKTLPKDPEEPLELPDGLAADILWQPESEPGPSSHALPPPEILEEALYNLQITLHPQTQHRATYPPAIGPLLEPTLALYCPIEGGDYVIDETVREIARRTDSEVLVLDSVQLAAGEWGAFGKAANLHLPRNPLHFRPSQPSGSRPLSPDEEEDDGESSSLPFPPISQMTLTLLSPQSGRSLVSTPVRRNSPPSKIKVFFDTLMNTSSSTEADAERPRPRLVYIRDFPTLAPSSSAWYPSLVSSVRARRRRTAARSSEPISYPVTIIFGMTPALVPTHSTVPSPISHSMQRPITSSSRSYDANWSEDEISDKARERRLRERLRRWERGESLQEDLPKLSSYPEGRTAGESGSGFIIIGGSNPTLAHSNQTGDQENGSEVDSLFFRTSVLVPRTRSLAEERNCRVKRRREINELTIRMGVGAIGGMVDTQTAATAVSQEDGKDVKGMWEDWGNRIEVWPTVRAIADRAVGRAVATTGSVGERTLDATPVTWPAIDEAWAAHWATRDSRKAWMKEAAKSEHEDDTQDDAHESEEVDEVVERLKNDPNLDSHERRLLPCIVNAASMPTSFSQVHLPAHTIDAVRTIVSLPLLHPEAFQQGILKEHGMSGCLLFGPPGTGKTLVVRALAKEAGCRMMAISPSDVMDMYVGEGEKLVKAVFSIARRLAPCVVFLDEIDALLGARVSGRETGSTSAHRGVLTEFMQEMDGLRSAKEIIVIGATNRPADLDDAVLRRLPRRLLVDLPGEPERQEILKILLRDESVGPDVDLKSLAKKTESFSGSDLKHLCVAAALDAVKENVVVPWSTAATADTPKDDTVPSPTTVPRTLYLRHFDKAFKEITPSSSEVLGSLADLRKWNAEFGEGRGNKKRQQVWGKDRFGFTEKGASGDGRVVSE